jgi:hypothetical protein
VMRIDMPMHRRVRMIGVGGMHVLLRESRAKHQKWRERQAADDPQQCSQDPAIMVSEPRDRQSEA